jgi:hypothetical protein
MQNGMALFDFGTEPEFEVPEPAMDRKHTTDEIRRFKCEFLSPARATQFNFDRIVLVKSRKDFNVIKKDRSQQRCAMKFFFLQGNRCKAISRELRGVLGEAATSLPTVKRWCQCSKGGNFSLDGENRLRRSLNDLANVISQFPSDEPFLWAQILAKRLLTNRHIIKKILPHDLHTEKLARRWVPNELCPVNMVKWAEDARMPLPAPRRKSDKNFLLL